jgi:DNA modification methylase
MTINKIEHIDAMSLLENIPTGYADLLLTDIPYNEVNRKSAGLRNLNKGDADILDIPLEELIREMVRTTKGSGYIFCGFQQISKIIEIIKETTQSVRLLVWEKSNPSPINGDKIWLSSIEPIVYFKKPLATFNEHCRGAVIRFPTVRGKFHPTQKSVKLFEYLIKTSTKEGDIVLDPFIGSGTTAIAAISLNRSFIGGDRNKEYVKIANERLKSTGCLFKLLTNN